MNTSTLVRPLRLGRPWLLRVADALAERFAALAHRAGVTLDRLRESRRQRQDLQAAVELSDATLRDMGAPEWLQAQAHAHREAMRFERQLLHIEPSSGSHHYF
jgi:hypothetical protein